MNPDADVYDSPIGQDISQKTWEIELIGGWHGIRFLLGAQGLWDRWQGASRWGASGDFPLRNS